MRITNMALSSCALYSNTLQIYKKNIQKQNNFDTFFIHSLFFSLIHQLESSPHYVETQFVHHQ